MYQEVILDLEALNERYRELYNSSEDDLRNAADEWLDLDRAWIRYASPMRREVAREVGGGLITLHRYLKVLESHRLTHVQLKLLVSLQQRFLCDLAINFRRTPMEYIPRFPRWSRSGTLLPHTRLWTFSLMVLFQNRVELVLRLNQEGKLIRKEAHDIVEEKNRKGARLWYHSSIPGCETPIWSPPLDA